jgi:hypothetical protein
MTLATGETSECPISMLQSLRQPRVPCQWLRRLGLRAHVISHPAELAIRAASRGEVTRSPSSSPPPLLDRSRSVMLILPVIDAGPQYNIGGADPTKSPSVVAFARPSDQDHPADNPSSNIRANRLRWEYRSGKPTSMLRKLFQTSNNPLITLIRLVVGVIFLRPGSRATISSTEAAPKRSPGRGEARAYRASVGPSFTLALVGEMIPLPTSPGGRTNRGQTSSRTTS